jgi:hypothetical protein
MNPFGELSSATTAAHLRTLPAIRDRCSAVYALATQAKLLYFDYHPEKEADVVAFCLDIIKVRAIVRGVQSLPKLHRETTTQIPRMYAPLS